MNKGFAAHRILLKLNSFCCLCRYFRLSIIIHIKIIKTDFVVHIHTKTCIKFNVTVFSHTCSCRNQFTDNDVLFQTDQVVNLTFDSSLSQNLGCLLEGCS